MAVQLERSYSRRLLTSLCSTAIVDIVQRETSSRSSEKKLYDSYLSALKVTLGVAIEAMTKQDIPTSLVTEDGVLSLFKNEISIISSVRNDSDESTPLAIVRNFIMDNDATIAEEDLGGVSELFTGHKATWNEGVVKLVHNPARRGAGKIYTPFDVTQHMCTAVARNLVSKVDRCEDMFGMKVLDPAVGSGAFCSQFVRCLWKIASKKWRLEDEQSFRTRVCQEMIHASDIDDGALQLARVVMWITAGSPESGIRLNFSLSDSLGAGPCLNNTDWVNHTGLESNNGYDAVFGNPPYVRVKQESLSGFNTKGARNMYSAFTELSINLLNHTGFLCFIVPQSIVGANETQPLRDMLLNEDASLKLQVFDSVPDFLFDQGKIEANTNTNINQRTTIVFLDRSLRKAIYTSPLLRWRRREERDALFKSLSHVRINRNDIHDGKIPMLENKEDLKLYRLLRKQGSTLSDAVVQEGGRILFIPKAIRYFISAVPIDLERPNTIILNIEQAYYEVVHATLNSNLFYWWWRVNGNGFQVEMKDILSFPLLPIDSELAATYSKQLDGALDQCRVFKRNAGKDIPNINYNYRQDILQEIDTALLISIDATPHHRIFGCKTNSLKGDMSALRGYMSEPSD